MPDYTIKLDNITMEEIDKLQLNVVILTTMFINKITRRIILLQMKIFPYLICYVRL